MIETGKTDEGFETFSICDIPVIYVGKDVSADQIEWFNLVLERSNGFVVVNGTKFRELLALYKKDAQ